MTLSKLTRAGLLTGLCTLPLLHAQNPSAPAAQTRVAPTVIEGIEFRGLKSVPPNVARAAVLSKAGEAVTDEGLKRDLTALWNTKRFEDIQLTKETGARGGVIVRFVVTERAGQP